MNMINETVLADETAERRHLINEIADLVMRLDQEELSPSHLLKLTKATDEELIEKKEMLLAELQYNSNEADLNSLY